MMRKLFYCVDIFKSDVNFNIFIFHFMIVFHILQGWCVFENRSVFLHTAIFRWRFFTHRSSTLFPKFIISAQFQHSFSLFRTESTFFLSFCGQKVPFETNFNWKPITFFVRSGNKIYFFYIVLKM